MLKWEEAIKILQGIAKKAIKEEGEENKLETLDTTNDEKTIIDKMVLLKEKEN